MVRSIGTPIQDTAVITPNAMSATALMGWGRPMRQRYRIMKTMSYADFLGVVASGRKNISTAQENVMPAFGDNPNVRVTWTTSTSICAPARMTRVGRVRPCQA